MLVSKVRSTIAVTLAGAILVLVVPAATPAGAVEADVTVVTLEQLTPYLDSEEVSTVAAVSAINPTERVLSAAAALPPVPEGQTQSYRAGFATQTDVYILDVSAGPGGSLSRYWSVDLLGTLSLLGQGSTFLEGGELVAEGVMGGWRTRLTGPSLQAGPWCDLCNAGAVTSTIFACGVGAGIGCVVKNGLSGFVLGEVCSAGTCATTKPVSIIPSVQCSATTYCTMDMVVSDDPNRQVTQLSSQVYWQGRPEGSQFDLYYPNMYSGGAYKGKVGSRQARYGWNHTSPYADCARTVGVYLGARFETGDYVSSGYMQPIAKPFTVSCSNP